MSCAGARINTRSPSSFSTNSSIHASALPAAPRFRLEFTAPGEQPFRYNLHGCHPGLRSAQSRGQVHEIGVTGRFHHRVEVRVTPLAKYSLKYMGDR